MTQANQCPICQQDNRCAMTTDTPIDACWCITHPVKISTMLAEYRERHPEFNFDDSQCLCPQCAAELAKLNQNEASGVELFKF